MPTATQIMLLAAAAGILSVGYIFSISAMRVGDVSFVTPFRYSILIFALLLGYFVFGDVPDALAVIGALIVVGSGLFNFYRERLLARKAAISSVSTLALPPATIDETLSPAAVPSPHAACNENKSRPGLSDSPQMAQPAVRSGYRASQATSLPSTTPAPSTAASSP